MSEEPSGQRIVVVHTAGTTTEAMIIRGLLESAGIISPGSVTFDPFPLKETPKGTHGVEIVVLESRADEARRLIAEFLQSSSDVERMDLDEKATE